MTARSEDKTGFVNPLNPNINIHILLSVIHIFLIGSNWENLHKLQDVSCLVIISFIPLT